MRLLFLKTEFFLQIVDVGSTVLEVLVIHDAGLQIDIGFDTIDNQFLQGIFHTGNRHVAVFTVADEFADHGIIVRRHRVARVDMRFPANAKAARRMEARDFAWAWQEGVRIFGIDTAFYRMASNDNFVLCDRQRLTRRDAQLLFDQIDAGNHFSHRVFNLNTGVHFDEIELAVFEQEFERPCAAIADVYARFRAAFADIATQFRRNAWRRGFFNHFLVATLHGTVAFRQIDSVALPSAST